MARRGKGKQCQPGKKAQNKKEKKVLRKAWQELLEDARKKKRCTAGEKKKEGTCDPTKTASGRKFGDRRSDAELDKRGVEARRGVPRKLPFTEAVV